MTVGAIGFLFLAAMFSAMYRAYSSFGRLSEGAYHSRVLTLELVRHPTAAAVVIGSALPVMFCWQRMRWQRIDPDLCLRPVICLLCCLLAVAQLMEPRNVYTRRRHIVDRLLLLLLAALSIVHPSFVVLTLGLGIMMLSQILFPLTSHHRILDLVRDRKPWPYYLLMFAAWMYGVILWDCGRESLLMLFLTGFAATYFWSAVGKLKLKWVRYNDLVGVLNTAVAHQKWDEKGKPLRAAAAALQRFQTPLLVGTIVLELAACLLCIRYEVTITLLVALGLFQLVVSRVSGIDFRAWSLMSVLLLFMVIRVHAFGHIDQNVVVPSAVAIAFGPILLNPLDLAWLDSRLCNVFRLYAVDGNGGETQLHPHDFRPYTCIFEQGRFLFLSDDHLLVNAWGETVDPNIVSAVRSLQSVEDLKRVESQLGVVYHNEELSTLFEHFIGTCFADRVGDSWNRISVRLVKYHFDGFQFRILEEKEARSILLAREELESKARSATRA